MPPHSSSHHPLKIVPKELVFPAPLNRVTTNILKLHNVSQQPLAYKVKTTAPQRYCVRPNNGVLPPGETIEVQVLLNYVKDAPPNLDTRDKFQIQSIVLTGPLSNATDIGEVWAKATPEQITKQKLKSRFTAATTKPAAPAVPGQPSTVGDVTHTESAIDLTTTTTPTITTSQVSSLDESSSSSFADTLQTPLTSQLAQTTTSQTIQQTPQSTLDKKDSLGDSAEHHEFFSPSMAPLGPQETKQSNIPQALLDQKLPEIASQLKSEAPHLDTQQPKPTGDYVVDSVANHSQLRKMLEQVAVLKSERENVLKDNQRLNDQVKTLTDLLQRAKEESQQTGLRQRTLHSTTPTPTPGGPTPTHSHTALANTQQSHIQIQTQVLFFIVFFFTVIGFLLGRFSH
eukprot:Phypoly_transcript_09415.p1 GENE.Phypoly_transcript_09415~~Phypoly_transcript_09415.p1  ORF type:complete len:399 (+),score=66.91 Phypoly_transcript_09415:94-1290(+)